MEKTESLLNSLMKPRDPNLLVLCSKAINNTSNIGITLASFLGGWQKENLAQVHMDSASADPSICPKEWKLSLSDVPAHGLGKKIFRILKPKRKPVLGAWPQQCAKGSDPKFTVNSYNVIRAYADLIPFRFSSELDAWLGVFHPQVIFSPLESIRIMKVALRIAENFHIPIVPFFADDWPSTLYSNSRCYSIPRFIMLLTLKRVLGRTVVGTGGSFAMAEEYSAKYKKPFSALMNAVAVPPEFPSLVYQNQSIQCLMVYAGRLENGRWQSILKVGESLKMLAERNIHVRLNVYAMPEDIAEYGELLHRPPYVYVCGSLPASKIPETISGADVLLHVESFDETVRKYTRLSLSTKVPQYMAAGRAILIFGPAEVSVSRYVASNEAGLVVSENSVGALAEAVERLACSSADREQYGRNGWRTACRSHQIETIRQRFREVIERSVIAANSGL